MKIDLALQIVIAQIWLICQITCYPGYNSRTNNRPANNDRGHLLAQRALTNSFLPGFGKRQGAPHENDARLPLPPAYAPYGSGLAGTRNMIDLERNNALPGVMVEQDSPAGEDLSRAALKELILDYLRSVEEMDGAEGAGEQIMPGPGGWAETGDNDRISRVLHKFKLLQDKMGSQGQPWETDAFNADPLKK